ncbi:hypothetical protein [Ectobacillus ponti]|uniref:Uncharacterized protein n=1 Tax=Ectobacillus ponti TaxID=2961894 RepID=A0AA41X1W1_9BACI|nr:hypothetical protein [Ectobacillus ponti]MCP8967222.1 hypothetical protein [Ectobacillus ponti]
MRNRFNKNNAPFLLLMLIHLLLLGRVWHKEPDKKQLFVSLMSNIGFAYIFEYVVLVLGKAYKYKPKLSRRRYIDNVVGAVFSQSIFIPIAALALAKANSGWKGRIGTAAAFTMIEYLFRKWKVYKTYWWSPLYTLFLLPFYFKWSQFWDRELQKRQPAVLFLSLYFCIWVTGMNTLYVQAMTRSYKFGIGSKHTWREHFTVAPLFSAFLALMAAAQIHLFPRAGVISACITAVATDVLLMRTGIIHSKYTYPPENFLGHFAMAWASKLYYMWIYKRTKETDCSKARS